MNPAYANNGLFRVGFQIADPGSGGKITPGVEQMFNYVDLVTAAAENRSIADPAKAGQMLTIVMFTDGGDATVTADTAVDEAGNTVITFNEVGQYLRLEGIALTATTFAWRVAGFDSVVGLGLGTSDVTIADGSGILIGASTQETTSYDGSTNVVPELQVLGTATEDSAMMLACFSLTATIAACPIVHLVKSGDAAIDGTHTIVTDNEFLGAIQFHGDDGIDLEAIGAQIHAEVDGTPGTGDMPGALVFGTSAESAESTTEVFRINSAQNLVIANSNGLMIGAAAPEVTSYDGATNVTPEFQVQGTAADDSAILMACSSETATINACAILHLIKSGNAAIGSQTVVTDGEVLGAIQAHGDDGTDLEAIAAEIRFEVNGTPGTGDMPGRIILATTVDGAEVATDVLTVYGEGAQDHGDEAITATTGGGTTGLITQGTKFATVTSDSAIKQISLPAATIGDQITLHITGAACELISAVAGHQVNNVTVGATNELALVQNSLYLCRYIATNNWIVTGVTNLGADEAALVPDAL